MTPVGPQALIDSSSDLVTVLIILFVGAAVIIGIVLVGRLSQTYDEIGGSVFDHPDDDTEGRQPPDAEYAEFGETMALLADEDETPGEDAPPSGPPPPRRQE
jgi:hypothetical protein